MVERKTCSIKDAIGYPTKYEECTMAEWDRTSEVKREFINFKDGRGFIFARPYTGQKITEDEEEIKSE